MQVFAAATSSTDSMNRKIPFAKSCVLSGFFFLPDVYLTITLIVRRRSARKPRQITTLILPYLKILFFLYFRDVPCPAVRINALYAPALTSGPLRSRFREPPC
ncbi:hypothetical protein CDAR_122421 [Caerostris darwini]|uniref:Uncharacterized protein n=1 Tax=Caerostris darwini TaxID=1538125 RepID=A0AAV4M8S1_9ARAC|nr:hypothetical protein CDAR_122421 [Caerostris darwini]